jgi:hypothetical protein
MLAIVFFLLQAGQSFVGLAGASINVLIDIFSNITTRAVYKYYTVMMKVTLDTQHACLSPLML